MLRGELKGLVLAQQNMQKIVCLPCLAPRDDFSSSCFTEEEEICMGEPAWPVRDGETEYKPQWVGEKEW